MKEGISMKYQQKYSQINKKNGFVKAYFVVKVKLDCKKTLENVAGTIGLFTFKEE